MVRHSVLLLLLVGCAFTDVARGKAYDAVTLPALFLGLALSVATEALQPESLSFRESLIGMALGGGTFAVVFLLGGLGGGDVKFMAAIGAIVADWRFTVVAMVYTAVVGGILALGLLIWKGQLRSGLRRSGRLLLTPRRARSEALRNRLTIPYGLAVAAGTLWAWMEHVAL